jgi:hypothetical protein
MSAACHEPISTTRANRRGRRLRSNALNVLRAGRGFRLDGVIDAACLEVIAADRIGEAPIVLDDADREYRDFHVCGLFVHADAVSMLIAHGDSLKSL